MARKVNVIVLRTAGTNCNEETALAFSYFGAKVDQVHVNDVVSGKVKLDGYHILAIPGGFSYGDDIAAGRILANELRLQLGEQIRKFVDDGKLIIGICNGFQVLTKTGLLPGPFDLDIDQKVTLTTNDSAKYEDRWTYLRREGRCIWTEGLSDTVYFPVAHAEGKFVCLNDKVLKQLHANDQVVFRYCSASGGEAKYPEDPNGSVDSIAGITDPTGRILGLMPHPERHFFFEHHPCWTRLNKTATLGDGAYIFQNGVQYIKENF